MAIVGDLLHKSDLSWPQYFCHKMCPQRKDNTHFQLILVLLSATTTEVRSLKSANTALKTGSGLGRNLGVQKGVVVFFTT